MKTLVKYFASIGYKFVTFVTQSYSVYIQHKQAASVIQYVPIHQDPNSSKFWAFMFAATPVHHFNYNLKVPEPLQS